MIIELAKMSDLEYIMNIYQCAIKFMKKTGNPNQWINGYPGENIIKKDIDLDRLYVCRSDNNEIVAVFCYFVGDEPTYAEIFDGKWSNNSPYGVVHRIASNGTVKKVADYCLNWCFEQHPHMRIDTHFDNITMQKVLERCGYEKCGIIKCQDGSLRLAFQKF